MARFAICFYSKSREGSVPGNILGSIWGGRVSCVLPMSLLKLSLSKTQMWQATRNSENGTSSCCFEYTVLKFLFGEGKHAENLGGCGCWFVGSTSGSTAKVLTEPAVFFIEDIRESLWQAVFWINLQIYRRVSHSPWSYCFPSCWDYNGVLGIRACKTNKQKRDGL